jgi:hypothetical protein
MENLNLFEARDRSSAFSPSNTRFYSEQPFVGTFQPSSYSHVTGNRSLESSSKFEEPVRVRESYGIDSRNYGLYNSAKNFYVNSDSEVLSDKIIKLENLLSHKESVIEELKYQKSSLSKEIDSLIYRIKVQEQQKDLEQKEFKARVEEFKYKELESQELVRSLQEELESSARFIHTLKTQISNMYPSEEFHLKLNENEELKAEIENLNQQVSGKKLDSKTEFLIFKLQEQVKKLTEDNENLQMSVSSLPTHKDLKDKEFIIKELREQLKSRQSRSRSTSQAREKPRTREKSRDLMRRDRELHHLEDGEKPSPSTLNLIFNDLMSLLKLKNYSEVIQKTQKLKTRAKCADLVDKLSKLVMDLSPEGSYEPSPTPKESWKFIIKVVQEYQVLKADQSKEEKNKEILEKIISTLGVNSKEEVLNEVGKLVKGNLTASGAERLGSMFRGKNK